MRIKKEASISLVISATALFLWSAALTVVGSSMQNRDADEAQNENVAAPLSYIQPNYLDAIILGKKNLYDDFLEIWLLQHLADPPVAAHSDRLMGAIRSVIRQGPKIESLYMISCIVMFTDYKAPQHCQEIVLAGLKVLPQSWKLPMLQGYVHNFLLHQPGLAASFFDHAAALPSSPPYVKRLALKLSSQGGITIDEARKNLELLLWDNPESNLKHFINR